MGNKMLKNYEKVDEVSYSNSDLTVYYGKTYNKIYVCNKILYEILVNRGEVWTTHGHMIVRGDYPGFKKYCEDFCKKQISLEGCYLPRKHQIFTFQKIKDKYIMTINIKLPNFKKFVAIEKFESCSIDPDEFLIVFKKH